MTGDPPRVAVGPDHLPGLVGPDPVGRVVPVSDKVPLKYWVLGVLWTLWLAGVMGALTALLVWSVIR